MLQESSYEMQSKTLSSRVDNEEICCTISSLWNSTVSPTSQTLIKTPCLLLTLKIHCMFSHQWGDINVGGTLMWGRLS